MPSVIKVIVPDKHVVPVLRLLKPYALDPPVVDPMDDTPNSPAVAIKASHNATISPVIYAHIKSLKPGDLVKAGELRQLCEANGAHANGYSYALKQMLKTKMLGRTKLPTTYEVLKHG